MNKDKKRYESLWRDDLIEILNDYFFGEGFKIESSVKILKDVYVSKNKNNNYEFQMGFFEQDKVNNS